jgi:hypothetical protein
MEWIDCTRAVCTSHVVTAAIASTVATRSGGALVVADAGTEDHTAHIRRIDPDGTTHESVIHGEAPPAHSVSLASLGDTVALFAAQSETFAYRSDDGGRTFNPAVVQR